MNFLKFHPNFIFRSPIFPINSEKEASTFNEALYLASPVLFKEYQKFLNGVLTDKKTIEKLSYSIYKYKSRASFRCTPFGLFAGLGIGTWGNKNEITIDSNFNNSLQRQTRLDMNVLCSISFELSKYLSIKPHLNYYPNTSIYKLGNTYRYVEYEIKDNRRVHKITKVDYTDYLAKIIGKSTKGAKIGKLITFLVTDDITESEAEDFINELIESQILINDLEPNLTGNNYFDSIIEVLEGIVSESPTEELQTIIAELNWVNGKMKHIDANISNSIDIYDEIYIRLKKILPNLSEINLFQTDLYKKTLNSTLDSTIQKKLVQVVNFLNRINPVYQNSNLEGFKKRFNERYEGDEVPLSIALDTEVGVGYPVKDIEGINPIADDIFAFNTKNETTLKWNELQSSILKLILKSIKKGEKILKVDETDFKNIDFSNSELPYTFNIMFKVIDSNNLKLEIVSIGGTSAINLLGRFGNGLGDLNKLINELAEFEQRQKPSTIIAEILHLPESRTGNVLARPLIRNYEIPYLAASKVSDEFQIRQNDLFVKVENDKIILIDKRLNKEIIPRLSNAHNFKNNSLPLYHFLCDIQSQSSTKHILHFDFGILESQFEFLPRVEYQDVIISLARWRIGEDKLNAFKKSNLTDSISAFNNFKTEYEIPNLFHLIEGDNKLLIDCSNQQSLEVFIDYVKHKKLVYIEEYLFNSTSSLVIDSENQVYSNECIGIVMNERFQNGNEEIKSTKLSTVKKYFTIGSDWLYFKIYCGVKVTDLVLTEHLSLIIENLKEAKLIDKWFFIRYNDSGTHIRFRLHLTDYSAYNHIMYLINSELSPLFENHTIANIQIDTYNRELARYGSESIEMVEDLFCFDSEFVVNFISLIDSSILDNIRWQAALISVDSLLNDFELTLLQKSELIKGLYTAFFAEHGGKKELKLALDKKYRELKKVVVECFEIETKTDYLVALYELLKNRSERSKVCIASILKLKSEGKLELELTELVESVIHMNLNRIFMGKNRTNEFIIYSLLNDYYKGQIYFALSKKSK